MYGPTKVVLELLEILQSCYVMRLKYCIIVADGNDDVMITGAFGHMPRVSKSFKTF